MSVGGGGLFCRGFFSQYSLMGQAAKHGGVPPEMFAI